MRLNQSESVQVGQIVNKLFLNLAPQILVGEADALSRKGLQALLSDSEIETVNRLSNQVASLKQTSSHACQRSAATNQAKLRPLPQAIPVLGKKTVLVPRSTHAPLTNLLQQAAKAGIDLHVRSAYRNDGFQIFLLLAMLRQNRFCVSSLVDQVALPDENEHSCLDHPAFDLWSSQMEEVTFERSQAFEWLQDNGPAFGFRQTYPEKNRRGFLPKPWHWQYAGIPLN